MYLFVSFLTLITYSHPNMSGIWELPNQLISSELMISHIEEKQNTLAVLKLTKPGKKPVYLELKGRTFKEKEKVVIDLESKRIPLNKGCSFQFSLAARGRLNKQRYIANGLIAIVVRCEGVEPQVRVEKMDGIWILKKRKGMEI